MRNDESLMSRLLALVVGQRLLCLAVSVSNQSISSRAEFTVFSWQTEKKALIYFDGNAKQNGR